MPNYDYECASCGHTFEAFQKMTDKPFTKCPKCQKKLRRLISGGAGLIFKGSGFYSTDYPKKTKSDPKPACSKAKEGCNACPHAHH